MSLMDAHTPARPRVRLPITPRHTVPSLTHSTAKQCYHCQGLGHVQADCPTLRLSGAGTSGRCYSCGQPGHLAVRIFQAHPHSFPDNLTALLPEPRCRWNWTRGRDPPRRLCRWLPRRFRWRSTTGHLLQVWRTQSLRS
ncbi:uncharacterized protein BDZ99DRAFT_246591 [Mytilinidion resinicola]|uniref:CCHC-type domain-containing protein n=1 Tax=Mytilinidion resinicola TaxID=574789 RepID=A0A6A6YYF5_9PEZI|nr:uncharacterized protein BDZ99DRAFT_246591 [Mytilinidion resinicola]KAF2812955.1 hypothetical protein BDZ99DRAFT_246591 [Mytilinidion resinicola]